MKVLIIDDDEMITTLWDTILGREGFEIVIAHDGSTGVNTAKTQNPDFILLDQIMPDMKGNDVLKILKSDSQIQNIPVAMISNYSDSKLMQDAIAEGAMDYILKYQIEPQDLVNKLKSLLQEAKTNNTQVGI